jgi:membrane protease YdiL (CAAX protease family)
MASVPEPAAAPPAPERTADREAAPWPWWMAPLALLLALGAALIGTTLLAVVLAAAGADVDADGNGTVNTLANFVQDAAFVGAALFLAARVGPVRPEHFGLRAPPRLAAALGWSALAAVAYLTFFAVWGALVVGKQKQDDIFQSLGVGRGALAIAVVAVLVCVVAPLAEEFLFRGFCFGALRTRLGVGWAAVAVGVVFGAFHVIGTPVVLLAPLAFLGFVFCLLRAKTGSLYPSVGLHAMNNSIAYASLVGWGWEGVPLAAGALLLSLGCLRAAASGLPSARDRALA